VLKFTVLIFAAVLLDVLLLDAHAFAGDRYS
jgi:hypothetical protein